MYLLRNTMEKGEGYESKGKEFTEAIIILAKIEKYLGCGIMIGEMYDSSAICADLRLSKSMLHALHLIRAWLST